MAISIEWKGILDSRTIKRLMFGCLQSCIQEKIACEPYTIKIQEKYIRSHYRCPYHYKGKTINKSSGSIDNYFHSNRKSILSIVVSNKFSLLVDNNSQASRFVGTTMMNSGRLPLLVLDCDVDPYYERLYQYYNQLITIRSTREKTCHWEDETVRFVFKFGSIRCILFYSNMSCPVLSWAK